MPKYTFGCKCGTTISILRPKAPDSVPYNCGTCNEPFKRVVGPATARMVETLDNGLMTRRVERPANAEQLYKDRAQKSEIDKHKL